MQAGLVLGEDLGDLALEEVAGPGRVGAGVETVVLGGADRGVDRPGREPLGVEAQVADDVARQPDGVGLVVDREAARVAQLVGVAPQDAHAGGVERRHPHLLRHGPDEGADAVLHLVGGLVGERDRQDLEGADPLLLDEVGDAMGEDPGLARPGTGDDEQRPLGVGDRVGLHWVEPGQQVVPAGGTVVGLVERHGCAHRRGGV